MWNGQYCPEGGLYHTKENIKLISSVEGLGRAYAENLIIEGRAVSCDENLSLRVMLHEGLTGVIERGDGALNTGTGQPKEAAILSCIGKPVCCKVLPPFGEVIRLSRRIAQEEALKHYMDILEPGRIISGKIVKIERFGVFIDIGRGIVSLIKIENISVSRLKHPSERFEQNQIVHAVVTGLDRAAGRIMLSHKELLGTWEENAALFRVGETVPGVIRSIKDYGIFIELTPNLSGLAEPSPGYSEGERVLVYIRSITPQRMKIKLSILNALEKQDKKPQKLRYYINLK